MLFVNFKTYEEATGDNAVKLAKLCEKVSKETGVEIIVIPQLADIYRVAKAVKLKVYAQHVDSIDYGSNTGHILVDSVKKAGADGTLLNHSEHRLQINKIKETVELCKHKCFEVLVCAKDPAEVEQMVRMEPTYVAFEPPELIGGDISVSTAKPDLITESLNKCQLRELPLIVGAGVKTSEDVMISKTLGAKGVLVASGIVKSKNPEAAIRELISGF